MRPSARHSYTSNQLREMHNHIKPTNLTSGPFGTIRTIHKLRLSNRIGKIEIGKEEKTAQDRINT